MPLSKQVMNRLLILCARDTISRDRDRAVEKILLEKNIDWAHLVRAASEEGVALFLYFNLKRFSDLVPASALSSLKKLYIRNKARNIYYLQTTKDFFREIAAEGLKALPIKGFRLALDLYSDIGLRGFVDVDLIVTRADWPRLVDILKKHGYSMGQEDNAAPSNGGDGGFYWTFRPDLVRDKTRIEIHSSIPGLHYPLDAGHSLWQERIPVEKEGISALCLSFEHELCLLCLHAQEHSYSRLDWMTDVAEIVTRVPLDWDKVLGFCDREKIHSSVFYGLHLANSFWPGTVPPRLLKSFDVACWELKALCFLWPENRVLNRNLDVDLPMHIPTVFPLLRKKAYLQFLKVTFRLFFPPQHWVSHYYRLPRNSAKMVFHYLWRVVYPFFLLARKVLKTG